MYILCRTFDGNFSLFLSKSQPPRPPTGSKLSMDLDALSGPCALIGGLYSGRKNVLCIDVLCEERRVNLRICRIVSAGAMPYVMSVCSLNLVRGGVKV